MRITSVLFTIAITACGSSSSTSRPPVFVSETQPVADVPRILVSAQPLCPGHVAGCDILEVVDLHTHASSEDKGFDELRRRAAQLGGDAVIGAEFEHGDGNEPSHLSGMIVRYSEGIPPHVVLGEVDIPSDEDSTDKGMAAMSARKTQMGGDRVIGVTFEHGEDGKQGHLRGQVIRYTR